MMGTKSTRDVIDLSSVPITEGAITGGTFDNVVIGANTPASGKFSSLTIGSQTFKTGAYANYGQIASGHVVSNNQLGTMAKTHITAKTFLPMKTVITPGGNFWINPAFTLNNTNGNLTIQNRTLDLTSFGIVIPNGATHVQIRGTMEIAITSGTFAEFYMFMNAPSLTTLPPTQTDVVMYVSSNQLVAELGAERRIETFTTKFDATAPHLRYIVYGTSTNVTVGGIRWGFILEGFWLSE